MTPSSKPAPAGERVVPWLLLLAALLTAIFLVRRAPHAAHPAGQRVAARVDPVLMIPVGPDLLITIDAERLGAATARDLLRAGGDQLLGLRELCGFEPLLALRRVVFAMPHASLTEQASDFALVAETSLQPEAVLRCAEALISKRGGKPVRSQLGRFSSVRDQQKPLGEVAIRGDGLFVLSGGQYFREVIDAASGASVTSDEAARLRSRLHASIRGKLGTGQITLTLLPGAALPLPGVQALGLGFDLENRVGVRGFVGCSSEPACDDARAVIDRVKSDATKDPSLSGLAGFTLLQRQNQLELRGSLPREQLASVLGLLLAP